MPRVAQRACKLLRRLFRRRQRSAEAAALREILKEACGDPGCGRVHRVKEL